MVLLFDCLDVSHTFSECTVHIVAITIRSLLIEIKEELSGIRIFTSTFDE